MSIQRSVWKDRVYLGINGDVYWFHLEVGRLFSLTIGEKKLI